MRKAFFWTIKFALGTAGVVMAAYLVAAFINPFLTVKIVIDLVAISIFLSPIFLCAFGGKVLQSVSENRTDAGTTTVVNNNSSAGAYDQGPSAQ